MKTALRLVPRSRFVTLAVASGKGGVGKTNVAANLAVTLAHDGHRVAVLDADFGLGNVDVLLGLTPSLHLGHVLSGRCALEDVFIEGPAGIRVLPASSGLQELTTLSAAHWQTLARGLDRLSGALDFLVIDTAPGIADGVIAPVRGSDCALVVTSPEPTAIVDAYALIKVLATAAPSTPIGLLVNCARDAAEADVVFRQLDVAVRRFLGREIRSFGFIALDPAIRRAVSLQTPVVSGQPASSASRAFRRLATHVAALATAPRPAGAAAEALETPSCA